ncbi:hypothetical protein DRP77_01275 [Candidatus Poribacteria bacterium]|nr:MAG: hypothetical protein DRP77_01275 [Candidatus Poribacteria bacterium]
MKRIPPDHPLIRHFRWSLKKAERTASVQPPPDVEDYICDEVLAKFVHVDNLYRIRDSSGKRVTEIAEILLEGEKLPARDPVLRDIWLHQYIGDYALFIAGLFPESLRRLSRGPSKDYLLMKLDSIFVPFESPLEYYIEQGRTSYGKVSRFYAGVDGRKFMLFSDLSTRFKTYVQLMSLVRVYLEANPHFQEVKRILTQ